MANQKNQKHLNISRLRRSPTTTSFALFAKILDLDPLAINSDSRNLMQEHLAHQMH
jgi:hypothetical protein